MRLAACESLEGAPFTTRPGAWPDLEFVVTAIQGRENELGMPIFLLPLDLGNGVLVTETQGGTVRLPDIPGFALEIEPGSVVFPGGSRTGVVSVTTVHSDKVPMVPNFGQQPTIIVTIQPPGARFDPPARLTLPNVDGLDPGEVTELYSFEHDLGHFVSIGPATVSDDGLVIVSNPGVGIVEAGWHCGGPPWWPFFNACGGCGQCEICAGGRCALVLGGACDDGNPCTINERCEKGGCTGDPVEISDVIGVCVAPTNETVSFRAVAPSAPNIDWAAPAGTPATGKGVTFPTVFSATGETSITASCGASSASKTVLVANACTNEPAQLEDERVPSGETDGHWGQVRYQIGLYDPKIRSCARDGKECFQLESLEGKYYMGINCRGRIPVDQPSGFSITDANCTPQSLKGIEENCSDIVLDLFPNPIFPCPKAPALSCPPYTEYVSTEEIYQHEKFHEDERRSEVMEPLLRDLAAFVLRQALCNDCRGRPPQSEVEEEMRRLFRLYEAGWTSTNPEIEAYIAGHGFLLEARLRAFAECLQP